jgi:RNA 2',3'-cyclic 3'-phosphodiesterase
MALFETARTFVALSIEVAGLRRVVEAADAQRALPSTPAMRWVSPPKLHVTLKFFGEIDAGLAPAIRDALAVVAKETPAPRLAFSGTSAFPSLDEARVVFAEVEDLGGETAGLARAIDDLGEAFGLRRGARAYVPHLTLARTREPVSIRTWVAAAAPWRVVALAPEVVFYRSDVARPGAEYDVIARFALAPRRSKKAS